MKIFDKLKFNIKKINNASNSKIDIFSLKITAIEIVAAFSLFLGLLIPLQVMSMVPAQFVIRDHSPLKVLLWTVPIYCILGIILFFIYFFIKKENAKKIVINIYSFLLIFLILNYFIYGTEDAVMNNLLVYDADIFERNYDFFDYIKTLIIIIISVAITYLLSHKEKLRKDIVSIILICITLFSFFKFFTVYNITQKSVKSWENVKLYDESELTPIYNFSTNKQNVVVFMVDRFTGKYFEQVLNNFPELKEKLTGFTFYPNTLSFGYQTTTGSPGLFGGYEYIPSESDKRSYEYVPDKHNEALKVMPTMFGNNNFDVVASNLPDVNYQDQNRKWPFSDLKNFKWQSYVGRIESDETRDNVKYVINSQRNHFVQYPFMMFLPFFLRSWFYNNGEYRVDLGDYGTTLSFLNFYVGFKNLSKMTSAGKSERNKAILINNAMVHEAYYLSYPDFELTHDKKSFANESNISIVATTSNIEYDNYWREFMTDYSYYDTCVRATKDLCNWLDYLKKLKVYDNTRIIITSDHGIPIWFTHEKILESDKTYTKTKYYNPGMPIWLTSLAYNPVLLYKDFNKKDKYKVSNEFMTNADTPYLAMHGLIKNMKNPYTGKVINTDYKNRKKLYTAYQEEPWQPIYHIDEKQYETVNRIFLSLEGKNIFDLDKWEAIPNFNSLVCDIHQNIVKHKKTEKETCGNNNIKDYYECLDCHECFYDEDATERIYDMSTAKINIPHKFTEYISNNDETEKVHGTMTASCVYGCGTKDTKGDPNVHIHQKKYLKLEDKLPSFDEDGYEGEMCSYCGKELGGETIPKLSEPELEYTEITYDGNKKEPKVTIKDGYGNIIADDKYRLKYKNNRNVGTAEIDITMRKPYAGTKTIYFNIIEQ